MANDDIRCILRLAKRENLILFDFHRYESLLQPWPLTPDTITLLSNTFLFCKKKDLLPVASH